MTADGDPHAAFLAALLRDDQRAAAALLVASPAIARESLFAAAAVGDAEQVAFLLADDPASAIRPADDRGFAAIHFAAHGAMQDALQVPVAQRVRTIELLLDAGASVNASVQVGEDAEHERVPVLYFACVSNNVDVARRLIERGAAVNDGESLYHAAEHDHRACLELLLEHGANLSGSHAYWGNTPLYFLAGYTERSDRFASVCRGMAWLLAHGADPNVMSASLAHDGGRDLAETPLHRVAGSHRTDTVALMLLRHGADAELRDGAGRTAYQRACRAGNSAVAEVLAAHGARTETLDAGDRLLRACHAGDGDTARSLLASDAALRSSLGADANQALLWASERDNAPAVALMLSLGWPHDLEGPWGGTPLHWAAWFGSVSAVRTLVEHGAGVNVRDSSYGSSPIAWAAHGSRFGRPGNDPAYAAIVRLLLDVGAERSASYNKWNEAPEGMASDAVATLLKNAGFAT